jgi:hypothetical protein
MQEEFVYYIYDRTYGEDSSLCTWNAEMPRDVKTDEQATAWAKQHERDCMGTLRVINIRCVTRITRKVT